MAAPAQGGAIEGMNDQPPIYINEDAIRDPAKLWAEIRAKLQARRHHRIVRELPPERTRSEIRKLCGRSQVVGQTGPLPSAAGSVLVSE